MKKLLSLVLVLVIVMTSAVALADLASAKPTDPSANRGISIQPAGPNPWPTDRTSPTTGRNLDELLANEDEYQDGFMGMAVTGQYYPVMVQHCGFAGGVGIGAPFYGSYADVFYELAKSSAGHSRMCMIFNDFLPNYAGASRSTRVGYIWIRQEGDAPYFYQGAQVTDGGPTDVEKATTDLKLPWSGSRDVPWSQKVLFNGLAGSKQWLKYKYRIQPSELFSECNVVWDLAAAYNELLGADRSFENHNHTWKFGDMAVAGEDAEKIYVLFKDDSAKQLDAGKNTYYYYNSYYEYSPEENVYHRYMIEDLNNMDTSIPFEEYLVSNPKDPTEGNATTSGNTMTATLTKGREITFANVIIQYIDMSWDNGGECPLPRLTGTGNADYFMGGKRYTGVWQRNSYDDRTVFYGEDGQEISLQPGRTMIVMMDYKTNHRAVKYE